MNRFPLVVDIKRESLEDGPGIRSVVFFKGCPLRCVFCHNPETHDKSLEIAFHSRNCIGCGSCVIACPRGAIALDFPGRILRDRCDRCGRCADACPAMALRRVGIHYPVEELTDLLLRDRPFYRHSEGGVTLSGGECTMFPFYLRSLLRRLKAEDIHIVLETGGYFDFATFRSMILPYLDLIYFDVKFADPRAHEQYCGRSNRRILDNFHLLMLESPDSVHPRIPLIPGITATRENISAIAAFLRNEGAAQCSLLRYNPLGLDKYETLGKEAPDLPCGFMEISEVKEAYNALLAGRHSCQR